MPAPSHPINLFYINALSRSVFATDDVCVDSVQASSCPTTFDAHRADQRCMSHGSAHSVSTGPVPLVSPSLRSNSGILIKASARNTNINKIQSRSPFETISNIIELPWIKSETVKCYQTGGTRGGRLCAQNVTFTEKEKLLQNAEEMK